MEKSWYADEKIRRWIAEGNTELSAKKSKPGYYAKRD